MNEQVAMSGSGRYQDKVVLVTGAGAIGKVAGTGTAIARTLAAEGAQVGLVDLSADRAEVTAAEIRGAGGRCTVLAGDVSKTEDCERVVSELVDATGRLDVLVNNAGIALSGSSVSSFDRSRWDHVLAVNLTGPMMMVHFARPHLARVSGAILNISSVAGLRGSGDPAYSASKAGLVGLTQELAYELGPEGIRVNCVAPGHIYSAMVEAAGETYREARRSVSLLPVEGTSWDVARTVAFLCSSEAPWLTGLVVPVDGGTTTTLPLAMLPRLVPGGPDLTKTAELREAARGRGA